MSSFDINLCSASGSSGGCWFKDRPCLIGAASCEAQGRSRSCLGKGWPPFATIAPAFIVRIVQTQIFFVQLRYQRIEGDGTSGASGRAARISWSAAPIGESWLKAYGFHLAAPVLDCPGVMAGNIKLFLALGQ
jgi:hypothetical protein